MELLLFHEERELSWSLSLHPQIDDSRQHFPRNLMLVSRSRGTKTRPEDVDHLSTETSLYLADEGRRSLVEVIRIGGDDVSRVRLDRSSFPCQ